MTLIAWIQSVASMIGSVMLNSIYSATLKFDGGMFAFFTAAGVYIIAGILAM